MQNSAEAFYARLRHGNFSQARSLRLTGEGKYILTLHQRLLLQGKEETAYRRMKAGSATRFRTVSMIIFNFKNK
jgi:hypothetical protein